MTPRTDLAVQEEVDRFARSELASTPNIVRDGGKWQAGLIENVSLATVGEALGHDYWLDATTLEQIASFAAAKSDTGVKSRFTHPSMSSDGMGRHLGRLFNVRVEGEKVLGDLHFAKSAHDTPDGDLADYVMTLTEEDPAAAGLSIVFHHDFDAESEFEAEHTGASRMFASPDARNKKNYSHVRLAELRAADVVDEPAANPAGMFDSQPVARNADVMLSYAAGLIDEKPKASLFGVDADRARDFFNRWLSSHGLSLSQKEADVAETTETAQPSREQFAAELAKFVDAFGAENGAKWYAENKSFAEGLELHNKQLQEQLSAEREARQQAEERLASMATGETEPVDVGSRDNAKPKRKFAEVVLPSKN